MALLWFSSAVLLLLIEFFGSLPCAKPITDDSLQYCYNSSFETPLNGSLVNDICRLTAIFIDHLSDCVEQMVDGVFVCVQRVLFE